MIPYSYNMVDMGGIDLAEANGTVVEGLYNRLALARNACGDLILYNWKFAEIEIAPGICATLDVGSSILINGLIQVTEEDKVTVLGIEPPPPPIEPVEPLVVAQNGVYEAEPPVSGFNPVTVNVSGGWPFMNEITEGGTGFVATVSGSDPLDVNSLPANIKTFYNNYCKAPKPTKIVYSINVTEGDAGLTLAELKAAQSLQLKMEYYGNVYGNTTMIDALGLVLLGDFSQEGAATGNALSDSISHYSAVILQGIYNRQRTSGYNTSMLYTNPKLGTAYWAGMKDRNDSYDCYVRFTDASTVSLSGNRQVIIYGVP